MSVKISAIVALIFGTFLISIQGQTANQRCICQARVDIIFVLDISKSIGQSNQSEADLNYGRMKNFTLDVVDRLSIGPEHGMVGVVEFARWANITFSVSQYDNKSDLKTAIKDLEYGNINDDRHETTNTPDALKLLRTEGQEGGALGLRDDADHIVIFITDGRANTRARTTNDPKTDAVNTDTEAGRLHNESIYDQIYTVGIRGGNNEINDTQLKIIATDPSLYEELDDFTSENLDNLQQRLIRQICECPVWCQPRLDIVFVIDISISIGQGNQYTADLNFDQVKNFILNVVNILSIGPDNSMVGMVEFARWANIKFNVSEYTNKTVLQKAIRDLEYGNINDRRHETTNTPAALKLLRTEGLEGHALGLRKDADHIVVFITDGKANTKKRTGYSLETDAVRTETAADELHEEGIYDQIYTVGIRGKNDEINETQLMVIATDPTLYEILDDYTPELLEDYRQDLIRQICGQQHCTAEGQLYSLNAPDCIPTCSDPNPSCSGTTQGCICPSGTVLDEIQNRCVPLSNCIAAIEPIMNN